MLEKSTSLISVLLQALSLLFLILRVKLVFVAEKLPEKESVSNLKVVDDLASSKSLLKRMDCADNMLALRLKSKRRVCFKKKFMMQGFKDWLGKFNDTTLIFYGYSETFDQ